MDPTLNLERWHSTSGIDRLLLPDAVGRTRLRIQLLDQARPTRRLLSCGGRSSSRAALSCRRTWKFDGRLARASRSVANFRCGLGSVLDDVDVRATAHKVRRSPKFPVAGSGERQVHGHPGVEVGYRTPWCAPVSNFHGQPEAAAHCSVSCNRPN